MTISLRKEQNIAAINLQSESFQLIDAPREATTLQGGVNGRTKLASSYLPTGGASDLLYQPRHNHNLADVQSDIILAHALTQEQEKCVYFPLERYRLLSTRVLQVARNLKSKVFLITSAIAEEGKTITAANLAFALSGASSIRTLIIDLDLRRPSLATRLGIKESSKASSYITAPDWHECIWGLKPNLHALVLSSPADRPEEAVHSEGVKKVLEAARQEYDMVIIDSAPLLLAVDTHVLLPMVDHALLVVRADHSPIACAQDAVKMLGDKALGCVLNDVKKMKYEEYYRAYYK
ncbi:CpsD/CapB family tyrosine-protein kinase [Acidipila rosea]|uniref:Capsular exopolysaccharide synthesis family protein n=1 Tax=Acidipila rosea TaxID=768535 RepID=A0A4R1LDF1_9BACT|nr:CpsD/CapB family tyrosine-protein kinase [Acidipila rosea]MBW4027388.1 CpsD/CapB family tyrosine-protein kinase [Acidobacteriota bacterium]TCK75540.1 capsular exopolysaccharide synthesis family protein [Acidipila rosea]